MPIRSSSPRDNDGVSGSRLALLACVLTVILGCTSTSSRAGGTTSSDSAPGSVPTQRASETGSAACGPVPTVTWPRSDFLPARARDELADAARRFVVSEASLGDPRVTAVLPASADPACGVIVHVEAAGLAGDVSFERGDDDKYVTTGFHLGLDHGGSLLVRGRHVMFVVAAECGECVRYSVSVRYGSAMVTLPEQAESTFEFDLPVDPSVWGAYCSSAHRSDGSIAVAGCSPVRPGDFAAS